MQLFNTAVVHAGCGGALGALCLLCAAQPGQDLSWTGAKPCGAKPRSCMYPALPFHDGLSGYCKDKMVVPDERSVFWDISPQNPSVPCPWKD